MGKICSVASMFPREPGDLVIVADTDRVVAEVEVSTCRHGTRLLARYRRDDDVSHGELVFTELSNTAPIPRDSASFDDWVTVVPASLMSVIAGA